MAPADVDVAAAPPPAGPAGPSDAKAALDATTAAAAAAAYQMPILPRSSSVGALNGTPAVPVKQPGAVEPPLPPKRVDSLSGIAVPGDAANGAAAVQSPGGAALSPEPLSPKSPRKNRNLLSGLSSPSIGSASDAGTSEMRPKPVDMAAVAAAGAATPERTPEWPADGSKGPIEDTRPQSPITDLQTHSLKSDSSPPPVYVEAPAGFVIADPVTPPIMVAEPTATSPTEAPDIVLTPPPRHQEDVLAVEESAALTAQLMNMLPTPVGEADPKLSPAQQPGATIQSVNSNLSPLAVASPHSGVIATTPNSPSSPSMFLAGDDAFVVSAMIGMEDPEAAARIRMQAQLVQAQPVVDHYAGRDLETVDEEEEDEDGLGKVGKPRQDAGEEEDPSFPRPGPQTEQSPSSGDLSRMSHSQSAENLEERDYSGPIISGIPRSASSPRLDQRFGGARMSSYQPNVSSPLAAAAAAKGPKRRRRSFRSNRPIAYGTARHSMVGLTPENMEELKKDAHAAIRDMLLKGAEEEDDARSKRSTPARSRTAPVNGSDPDLSYSSFSRPESQMYYPDEAASQMSEPDRSSTFAPSMRTSHTSPDMNRSPPNKPTFRGGVDHRASMMALDQLMHGEGQMGGDGDDFELPGGFSSSDLAGDMSEADTDAETEDGSSGRGSSLPGNDTLFDSDILSLDQAQKALKYARRTQDVDERYHFLDFLLDHLTDLPWCDDKGRGPSADVTHSAIKLLRRLAYVHYHPPSQYTLGNLFITGLPDNVRNRSKKHKPDYARAFELWVMAAKRNHADATYNVALCTERGLGTRSSQRRAADFFRKAAVLNHPGAMTRLGMALLNGELGLSRSPRDAVKWLRIALKYADTRFPRVCVELSKLHAQGIEHVVLRDDDYAFELLKRGSELGDPEAQHRLGRAYELGRMHSNPEAPEVTTPSPKIAIQLYQAAANQGHADSMLEISGWYLTGWPRPGEEVKVQPKRFGKEPPFTFPQSDELAYKWARQAAEKGLGRGFYAVAYFYEHGIGTGMAPDTKEACRWYEMAAKKGDKSAVKKVQDLGGKVSRFSMIWPSSFSIGGSVASASSSKAPSLMSSRRSSTYSMSVAPPAGPSMPMVVANDLASAEPTAPNSPAIGGQSEAPSALATPVTATPRGASLDGKSAAKKQKKGRRVCLIQ